MIFNIFGQSRIILHSLEDSRRVWKISGHSERFPYSLENVLESLEDFVAQSGIFPDCLEYFPTFWTISGQSGEFLVIGFPANLENVPDSLEDF